MDRVEIHSDKQVIPHQLKEELGGCDLFTSEDGVVQAEGCTKAELQAAVDAHTPRRVSIRERLDLSDDDIAELKALLQ